MHTRFTIPLDDPGATIELVGGKGFSLARMARAGLPVPGGFHIVTDAYRKFITINNFQTRMEKALAPVDLDQPRTFETASQAIIEMFENAPIPDNITDSVCQAYASMPGSAAAVAVRSSATAEDLPEASFAGQQDTFLNVRGADAVLNATRKCWASLWTARSISYRAHQGIASDGIALAVIVQLLVNAEAAGILFTANPLNGRRDQMLISATWGLGEAVVGGLVTPDTLTLAHSDFKVLDRQTGNKLVQTVRVEAGTQQQEVPEDLRLAPVLSDEQAASLAQLGRDIESLYRMPMDIEWTLEAGRFAIVQARPITALPKSEQPVPTAWKLPEGAYSAMRNNIIELMANPLTPLFRTLGLSAVNASMKRQMASFMGSSDIMPEKPIINVNGYAYYNGSITFKALLKILFGSVGIARRMFTGAVERWTELGRPACISQVRHWQARPWQDLPAIEILRAARELSEAAIDAYMALVSGVIPAAWISEGLFTLVYRLVKRRAEPLAPTYLLGFDSLPILAEKALYDLAEWTADREDLATYLTDTPTIKLVAQMQTGHPPSIVNADDWDAWQLRFQTHLQEYGHTIYDLDFASPVPADDPAPVLETLKLFLNSQGIDPYKRQEAAAERREQATRAMENRLRGFRLKAFRKNLARAQRYAPLREDGLADIGLGYPLLRRMLRELGCRFTDAGAMEHPDDIFWLEQDEVDGTAAKIDNGQKPENLSAVIPERKAHWKAARKVTPPMMLPQVKIFGIDLGKIKSGGRLKSMGDTLKGVAASPGSVTAPACVITGPEDFSQMKTGDVLVAPLTTPAWTPLFARASAIVTDVGGPLSHGSIVAREYGIPAVLGTNAATKRIHTGQIIRVDGSAGVVTLSENGHSMRMG